LVDVTIDEFFDFAFKALPHKLYQPEGFYNEVADLKGRFNDPSNSAYLWKDSYTTDIPADGWPAFASNVWETIKSNKDLDLPSQKEMLAMYRCDEILEAALSDFNFKIEPLRKQLTRNPASGFGETGSEFLRVALGKYPTHPSSSFLPSPTHNPHFFLQAQYDGPASRYHAEVAARKRESLKSILLRDLHDLFQAQVSRLREQAVESFDKKLENEIPSDSKKSIPDFGSILDRITKDVFDEFNSKVQQSYITDAPAWDHEQERQILQDSINSKSNQARQTQLTLFLSELNEHLNTTLAAPVSRQLDAAAPTTWPKIRELYETARETSREQLSGRLSGKSPFPRLLFSSLFLSRSFAFLLVLCS
jgi:hypothetical protein